VQAPGGKAPKTIDTYKTHTGCLHGRPSESLGGDLPAVTEDDVATYLEGLPARGSMRGQKLRGLRSFYGCVPPFLRGHEHL
jgi:hypothetical protein